MGESMKAAMLTGIGEMAFIETEKPAFSHSEMLVRVKAATICGTDIRIVRGKKTKGVRIPSIIGHEFAGEVVETGKEVGSFSPGDRVCVDPVLHCGHCFYCLRGLENVCMNRKAIGYEYDGCFAEYVCIPADYISKGNVQIVPRGVSWVEGALAEPFGCCLNGQRRLDVSICDTVVVIGAGPIGLMHVALAKASGAGEVIVSEPNKTRREMAMQFGADLLVDPLQESLEEAVYASTQGIGADVVILAIGNAQLADIALKLARKGGSISFFAGFTQGDRPPLDVNLIHYNEVGIFGASALQRRDLHKALELMDKKRIDLKGLVSHTFTLENILEAVELVESGDAIKVALTP